MALNTKTIKRRIKSIANTKKITKAMELISAVKMRKAVQRALASRTYSATAIELINSVATKSTLASHPLLHRKSTVEKVAVVIVTSNRGLAGGFTSKLLQVADIKIRELTAQGKEVDVIITGKKGRKIYTNFRHSVVAEFDKVDITTDFRDILSLNQFLVKEFLQGTYQEVYLGSMKYVSALRQVPAVEQFLPLPMPEGLHLAEEVGDEESSSMLFEPTPARVLEALLPRIAEATLYQSVLDSDAAEHSARMLSMRNATDAAKEMITELVGTFNKARQAAITQEIMEVVSGASAIK
jgi:F-type H+-transporting ATPase subunit gamma